MTTTSLRISILVICAIVCTSYPCISAPQGVSTREARLPTTAAELDSWLVGTDWHMYYRWENESYDIVLRFQSDGKVLCLNDAREWREDRAPKTRNYRALGSRNVQFGMQTWVVTFDSKMRTFAGTCKQLEGVRCRGKRILPKRTTK